MKFRITLIATREYTPNPQWYPGLKTAEEMLNCDIDGVNGDFQLFLTSDDVKMEVKGEILEDK